MILLPDFKEDYDWMAKKVFPAIKAGEVKHAIEVMLRLKLIKRNQSKKLEHTHQSLTTDAEVDSFEIFKYQSDLLGEAKNAMVSIPASQRDITSLTIAVPTQKLPEFKKRLQKFREGLVDWINRTDSGYDEVYQLNIQLYPVTRSGD